MLNYSDKWLWLRKVVKVEVWRRCARPRPRPLLPGAWRKLSKLRLKKDVMQKCMGKNRTSNCANECAYNRAANCAANCDPNCAANCDPNCDQNCATSGGPPPASSQPLCRHPFSSNGRQGLRQHGVRAAQVQSTSMAFLAQKPEVRQLHLVKTHVCSR